MKRLRDGVECEQTGRYEEAELARLRLDQLRQHEEKSRRDALLEQQLAERMGVEEAHMLGLQEIRSFRVNYRDLLNLRKIQETLAKMRKYAEAEKTKAQADKLEAKEHNQWKEILRKLSKPIVLEKRT
eukprot:g2855.t1